MGVLLRIELAIFSIVFLIVVVRCINKKNLQLKYSFAWIIMSLGSAVFAIFPGLAVKLSRLLNIETPSNFIFLIAIIVLLVLSFYLTLVISKQSLQIKELIQSLSIHKHENEKK